MKKFTECMTRPACMCSLGSLGVALLIVGIVTAAINATFAAFTPVIWLLLALSCYLGMMWAVLMRILARLESKTQS